MPRPGLRKYYNLFSFVKFKNMLQTGKLELDVDILSNHNMAMDIVVRWIFTNSLLTQTLHWWVLILRVLKIIGCPHGCSDKNVWASGEFLREAATTQNLSLCLSLILKKFLQQSRQMYELSQTFSLNEDHKDLVVEWGGFEKVSMCISALPTSLDWQTTVWNLHEEFDWSPISQLSLGILPFLSRVLFWHVNHLLSWDHQQQ